MKTEDLSEIIWACGSVIIFLAYMIGSSIQRVMQGGLDGGDAVLAVIIISAIWPIMVVIFAVIFGRIAFFKFVLRSDKDWIDYLYNND